MKTNTRSLNNYRATHAQLALDFDRVRVKFLIKLLASCSRGDRFYYVPSGGAAKVTNESNHSSRVRISQIEFEFEFKNIRELEYIYIYIYFFIFILIVKLHIYS